jgi:hypothetical protein
METGADDFLQKPVPDDQRVAAVQTRVKRFGSLAEQINRDSLTGLLNHIAFTLQLEAELLRTVGTGSPLTLAMPGIDHFKRVDDRYGHPIGDRVIRSAAILLSKRQRLFRRSLPRFVVRLPIACRSIPGCPGDSPPALGEQPIEVQAVGLETARQSAATLAGHVAHRAGRGPPRD